MVRACYSGPVCVTEGSVRHSNVLGVFIFVRNQAWNRSTDLDAAINDNDLAS
jgi:hypothetical protein